MGQSIYIAVLKGRVIVPFFRAPFNLFLVRRRRTETGLSAFLTKTIKFGRLFLNVSLAGKARSVSNCQVLTTTPVGYASTASPGCKHTQTDRPGGPTTGVLRQEANPTTHTRYYFVLSFLIKRRRTRFAPHLSWGTRT